MADRRPPIETLITVNDGNDRTDRLARTHVLTGAGGSGLVLEYERRDGSAGRIHVPMDAVTRALDAAGVSPRPTVVTCYTCSEHGTSRTYGPYTSRATASAVARGKGDWGQPATADAARYVAWRDEKGELWGLCVVGEQVRLREAEPKDAAIEAALSKLEPAERALLEAAFAC